MSLRATELEARIWRVARERMAKRPRLLAEYYRRRWGRWKVLAAHLSRWACDGEILARPGSLRAA